MTKNTTTNYQNNAILASQDTSISLSTATANFASFGSGMTAHLKAWISALQKANDLLPSHLRFDDIDFEAGAHESGKISLSLIEQLEALPVFALSVVVQKQALLPVESGEDKKAAFEAHIAEWATQNPLWQIIKVVRSTDTLQDRTGSDRLTPVLTYRYILMPTDTATMQPGKKAAAARLLDDGITSHLRQFIETLPITDKLGGDAAIDCHIVSLAKMLRPHRVAVFDMDSTLIEQEVIVELAKKAGIGEQVDTITESAMRGEIDFAESFTRRVALLKGLSSEVLEDIIANHITFSPGAKRLISALKNHGYYVVLVSGGFNYFAEYVKNSLGMDESYANDLDIVDNLVTGEITSAIVDGKRKAEILQAVAQRLGIKLSETVAVGDGANDLPMLGLADIGIAYRAKPIVRDQADYAVTVAGLDGVMTVLGLSDSC